MHDDVVTLLEHHLLHLETVRRRICAARQVTWGERGAALAESVAASHRYAATAAALLAQLGDVTHAPCETVHLPSRDRIDHRGHDRGYDRIDDRSHDVTAAPISAGRSSGRKCSPAPTS